jgi:hypothetical protein
MKIKTVAISSISQDPANLRKHGERNIDAIVASLRKFGQQHPIVIDSKGIILSGNGRYMAAVKLGWTDIKVVESSLTGSAATAYAIADNRTAELAEWDTTALAETLRALQSEEFDTTAAGYSDVEIDALVEGLGSELLKGVAVDDPDGEWQGMPDFEQEQVSEVQLIVYFPSVQAKIDFFDKVNQPITGETKFIWFPKSAKPQRQSVETMLVVNEE